MPIVPPRASADPDRRRLLAALLGLPVAVTGGLTACTDGPARISGEPVQLSVFWWGGQQRADLTEQALRLYTARHPQVTFRVTWQDASGYYERLATQAAGGNVPDLFQIDDTVLTEYAQRQILFDLTDHVADDRLNLHDLSTGLVRYSEVEGRTMAVAAAQNAPALVFNRALLRRLGQPDPAFGMTYSQYIAWARRVTAASGGRVAGTMDPSGDYKVFWLWLRSRGGELYQRRQLGCSQADLIEWFELWQRARAVQATPGAASIRRANGGDVARQLVVTGDAAASFVWSNQFPELQKLTRDELGMVSYPGPQEAQWARASMYWAVFRGTRHADIAVDVINFLTNDPAAGQALGIERGLNVNLSVRRHVQETLTDESLKRSSAFEISMADRNGAAPPPPPRGHAAVCKLLVAAAESIQAGRVTVRDATLRFMAQASAALAG